MINPLDPNILRRDTRRFIATGLIWLTALYIGFGFLANYLSIAFWKWVLTASLGIVGYWIWRTLY